MIRIFNAIQISALLAAGPSLLPLLKAAVFPGASALFWVAAIVYVVLFIWNTIMVVSSNEMG